MPAGSHSVGRPAATPCAQTAAPVGARNFELGCLVKRRLSWQAGSHRVGVVGRAAENRVGAHERPGLLHAHILRYLTVGCPILWRDRRRRATSDAAGGGREGGENFDRGLGRHLRASDDAGSAAGHHRYGDPADIRRLAVAQVIATQQPAPLVLQRHRRRVVRQRHAVCRRARRLQRRANALAPMPARTGEAPGVRCAGQTAAAAAAAGVGRRAVPLIHSHCPGRKPPFWAVERPARPYKSPIHN
jgi:hypothetical protein